MDDAVLKYQERRQKRLDKKAVENYRVRRDARMNGRADAEEEENNGGGKKGGARGGGHGNTRLPFGLCQREGIHVDPKWSPADAWAALEGKGYSAKETYKELKKTGKVAKRGGGTKPPTKVEVSHFPAEMQSKTYRKNTEIFTKYISEHCDDGNITEFLSSANGAGGIKPSSFSCKKLSGPDGCCVSFTYDLDDITISIPTISKAPDEKTKAQSIRSFAHEWTHYLDMMARDGKDHFTESNDELMDAIDKAKAKGPGQKVLNVFSDFKDGYTNIVREYNEKMKTFDSDYAKKKFGDSYPEWLRQDGEFNYGIGYDKWLSYKPEMKKYESERKKALKDLTTKTAFQKRAYMEGATNLQGIYDSISGGEMRDRKICVYGHSLGYFRKNDRNRAVEAIADYVALKATGSPYAKMFQEDQPELAKAFDDVIAEMTRRLK